MGSDITPGDLRGFLLPLPLSNSDIWEAQSTFSTAEKKAGFPIPSGEEKLVLTTTGDQINSINVKTQKAGTPGRGAGFIWKNETSADYYGDNSPNAITDYQMLEIEKAAPLSVYKAPSSLALKNGDVLVSFVSSEVGGDNGVLVRRLAAGTTSFTNGSIVYDSVLNASLGTPSSPAMCQLADGSVLLVHWVTYTTSTSAGLADLYVYRSTDGINFTQVSRAALDAALNTSTYTLGRLHIEEYAGQVLLVGEITYSGASDSPDIIYQAASIDEGMSFTTVGTLTDNKFVYRPSLVKTSDGILITYLTSPTSGASSDGKGECFLFPHAYYPFADRHADFTYDITSYIVARVDSTGPPHPFLEGEHTSFIDDEGIIFSIFRNLSTQNNTNGGNGGLWMCLSEDNGKTWKKVGVHQGANLPLDPTTQAIQSYIFSMNSDSYRLRNLHCSSAQGKTFLFSQFETTSSTIDDSILAICLRGYSDISLPERGTDSKIFNQFGYNHSCIPFATPDLLPDWTTSGVAAVSIEKDGLQINTGPANNRSYTYTFSPSPAGSFTDSGIIARFVVRAVSGGTTLADERAVKFDIDDSTKNYTVTVRISNTEILIRDDIGASNKGTATPSPSSILTDTGVEILIAIGGGRVSCWYRPNDHSTSKGWNEIVSNGAIADGGGGGSNTVQLGHIVNPVGAVESRFGEFTISYLKDHSGYFYPELYNGFTNPTDLIARNYPSMGNDIYVSEGLFLSTQDGPAYRGDEFTIDPQSTYDLKNIFYSHSPNCSSGWRSQAITGSGAVPSEFIALKMEKNNENIAFMSDLLALHLEGINFREFTIEGYNQTTSSWVVLATVSTSISVNALRYGDRLQPDPAASNIPYFFHNELAGWTAQIAGATPVYREIKTNSEGSWKGGNQPRMSIIQLADSDPTDPASGSVSLMPDKATVVFQMNGARYSAIGIRISAQNTRTNDFRIGHLSFGPVHVVAPQYGRGREISYQANVEQFEQTDGIVRVRKRGKGKKSYRLSWSEPIDMSAVFPYDGVASPDYYRATNTAGNIAVSSFGDAPFNILGYVQHMDGPARPIVYLPRIKTSTSPGDDIRILNRKEQSILCMLDEEASIQHVVGGEFLGSNSGECFRINTITLNQVI